MLFVYGSGRLFLVIPAPFGRVPRPAAAQPHVVIGAAGRSGQWRAAGDG